MKVNKDVIKQKKAVYGNNFECIANKANKKFNTKFEPKDIAKLMYLMKECRLEAIDYAIRNTKDFDFALTLDNARMDTVLDMENYLWISDNYEKYKSL